MGQRITCDRALFAVGCVYLYNLKDYDKAVEAYEAYEQKFPMGTKRGLMPYCFALCYEGKGETGKAIEVLEKALEEDPNIRSADSCRKKLQQLREGGNN